MVCLGRETQDCQAEEILGRRDHLHLRFPDGADRADPGAGVRIEVVVNVHDRRLIALFVAALIVMCLLGLGAGEVIDWLIGRK